MQFLLRIPVGLQEVVTKLVSVDTRKRSSTHFVATIGYFADPAVQVCMFPNVGVGVMYVSYFSTFVY